MKSHHERHMRRPRGNWDFDGRWVSWGPCEEPPSERNDFTLLVRVTPGDDESNWIEEPEPTAEDYRAIINGMAARLATTLHEQVTDFHRAMDLPVEKTPVVPPDDVVRLRARLIMEEAFETIEAMFDMGGLGLIDGLKSVFLFGAEDWRAAKANMGLVIDELPVKVDMPAFADALADVAYVLEGAALTFGIDSEPVAAEVHRANMAKAGGPRRADGKIGKPKDWLAPDVAGELRRQGWRP